MRKVKHWLHIVLTILTSGLWLPVYVILLATTEMFNRGYREGKAAGRVARQNEIDEERAIPKTQWVTPPDSRTFNCRCVAKPVVTHNTFERFKELGDRMLSGQPLDQYEQLEYNELRAKVINP